MTKKQIRTDFHVVILGAGKQSTFMLINALSGFFGPIPDKAVFCDLGSEPDFVYKNLDFLQKYCIDNFDFHIDIIKMKPIDKHILNFVNGKVTHDSAPPFYLEHGGMLERHCTTHYKIRPIRQYLTQFQTNHNIFLWIGISLDEIERMKKSNVAYITNKFPLIEKKIRIDSIKKYFESNLFPEPGKSSCYFCPFHSHRYCQLLKKQFPAEFEKACIFDEGIRNYPNI